MTLKLLATRSIESPWVNNTSCSGCKPLFVKKEIINTLFVLYDYADEMKIGLLVIQLYYSSKPQQIYMYRISPCIMRTFFTTFEAEKLRCALYTEPFVSEALLICINKRNNSRWLFPGLLLWQEYKLSRAFLL